MDNVSKEDILDLKNIGCIYRLPMIFKYEGKRWRWCITRKGRDKLKDMFLKNRSLEITRIKKENIWLLR
tara:strand:- start:1553 stop:1759 length:207 start_codon:yes stop_codon:yes gene_type:complete